jgi:hypothetical protein
VWEDKQFKDYLKAFPNKSFMSVVDFAKKYSFEIYNEVQNMHWYFYQISILVHICFRHNPEYDPYDEETRILIKYHFYVFDDHKHDSKFAQHCFKLHWQHILEQRYALKWHFVWSNGCVT